MNGLLAFILISQSFSCYRISAITNNRRKVAAQLSLTSIAAGSLTLTQSIDHFFWTVPVQCASITTPSLPYAALCGRWSPKLTLSGLEFTSFDKRMHHEVQSPIPLDHSVLDSSSGASSIIFFSLSFPDSKLGFSTKSAKKGAQVVSAGHAWCHRADNMCRMISSCQGRICRI